MTDPNLMARLAAIEDRLSALERAHSVPVAAPALPPPPPPPPSQTVSAKEVPPPLAPPPAPAAPASPPTLSSRLTPFIGPNAPASDRASSADAGRADGFSPASLERFLGGQVTAWIGALVVIAAIGIFAKFAIDQGWFERTPPAVKLALAYAVSGACIVAGLLLRERLGRLPSGALLAGGIGGLFVSTCAGVAPLNVFGPEVALLAGVGAAIVGGALTLRSRELAVGAVSLIGAYVVPIFANIYLFGSGGDDGAAITGALYLTGIYAVALTLARLGPSEFTWLRLAGIPQAISGLLLLLAVGGDSPAISLAFTGLWWAMAVGECSIAAMRGHEPRFNTACTVAATSIAATLALRGAFATNPWADPHSWLPLAMGGLALAAALYLRSLTPAGGEDERDYEENPDGFAIAHACSSQSSILLILAGALAVAQVGVVVRGGALPVTWTVMGAAAILIGRRMDTARTAGLGLVSIFLGIIATAIHALISAFGSTTLFSYPSDPTLKSASAWSFRFADVHWAPLLVAFGLLFSARFWSIGSDPTRRAPLVSGLLAACAALIWIGLSLAMGFSYASVLILLAIPIAALLAGRTLSLIKLIALLGSTIAALAWFAATLLHVFENLGTDAARPTGGAIAAALVVGAYVVLGRRFRGDKFSEIPTAVGFGFGLAALATLLLVEQLAGPTDRTVTTATIWASLAVGVVATIGAIAAKRSKLELSEGLGLIVVALATAVTLFMTVIDAVRPASGVDWVFHWLLSPANLAVVVLILCGLALRGTFAGNATVTAGIACAAGAVALISPTALVCRFFDPRVGAPFPTSTTIQQSALSVWLAILAVLFIAYGFRRKSRAPRWTGLALLGVVALKVLVLDMANAETIWRVAALFVTGLLLVATSAVYARAARAQTATTAQQPPAAP